MRGNPCCSECSGSRASNSSGSFYLGYNRIEFALDLSELTCKLGNFLQDCDQFGIGSGDFSIESAVGCSERCHRGAITGSGRG